MSTLLHSGARRPLRHRLEIATRCRLLRAGLGIILMAHGCQKLFGMVRRHGVRRANAALFEGISATSPVRSGSPSWR